MSSIVGERWRNATSSDLAALDTKIAAAQVDYDKFVALLKACRSGKSGNPFYSCNKHQGFTQGSLENHVADTKTILTQLQNQRVGLAANVQSTLDLQAAEIEADKLSAESTTLTADAATESGKAAGVWIAVVAGALLIAGLGIYGFKKLKK